MDKLLLAKSKIWPVLFVIDIVELNPFGKACVLLTGQKFMVICDFIKKGNKKRYNNSLIFLIGIYLND